MSALRQRRGRAEEPPPRLPDTAARRRLAPHLEEFAVIENLLTSSPDDWHLHTQMMQVSTSCRVSVLQLWQQKQEATIRVPGGVRDLRGALLAIARHCSVLQKLNLRLDTSAAAEVQCDSFLDDNSLLPIVRLCGLTFQELDLLVTGTGSVEITDCTVAALAVGCPNLEFLGLGNSSTPSWPSGDRGAIINMPGITNKSISFLGPKMLQLEICGGTNVVFNTGLFQRLAECCPILQILALDGTAVDSISVRDLAAQPCLQDLCVISSRFQLTTSCHSELRISPQLCKLEFTDAVHDLSLAVAQQLAYCFPGLREIILTGMAAEQGAISALLSALGNLKELTLGSLELSPSPEDERAIADKGSTLKCLELANSAAIATDALVERLSLQATGLEHLSLYGSGLVTDESMRTLSNSPCRLGLVELDLTFCTMVTFPAVLQLVQSCPRLGSLGSEWPPEALDKPFPECERADAEHNFTPDEIRQLQDIMRPRRGFRLSGYQGGYVWEVGPPE